MDFYERDNYTLEALKQFLDLEEEESPYLDYKNGAALAPEKIDEITKDVSAFANSDGGVIIYGVDEDKETHKPKGFAPVTDAKFSKEWLEQKINLIKPKIRGLRIFPIRLDKEASQSIYIVRVPRSDDAPHMANDNRYYKRDQFSCNPMHGYEVRDIFNRVSTPSLRIMGVEFEPLIIPEIGEMGIFFKAFIQNDNKTPSTLYKMNTYIYTKVEVNDINIASEKGGLKNCTFVKMDSDCIRLSIHSNEPIFKDECVTLGNVYFQIPEHLRERFMETVHVRTVLFYEGGFTEYLYIPKNGVKERDKASITSIIKSEFPKYRDNWL